MRFQSTSVLAAIAAAVIWAATPPGIAWTQVTIDKFPGNQVPIIMPLVGRTLDQVIMQLGEPYQVFPLHETGGKLLMFETRHHDQFVIETDGTDRVVKAFVKHPESR